MRRYLGVTLSTVFGVLALVALVGVGSAAAQGITGTFHDLRAKATTTGATITQICIFCHTPHNSVAPADMPVPLWNRDNPAGTFTMYSSPTMNMTVAGSPQGVSLACLSCHDGVTAYDALKDVPFGWTPGSIPNTMRASWAIGNAASASLTNDHPISVTYNVGTGPGMDPAFNAATSGKVGALPLYGASADQVECASCHDVHNFGTSAGGTRPFLRVSKDASAICTTCHIK